MSAELAIETTGRNRGRRLYARVWEIVRAERRRIVLGLALLLAGSACRLALPWVLKHAIDEHLRGLVDGARAAIGGLLALAGLYALIAGAEALLRRWQMITVDTAGQNALSSLRVRLFRHLQSLSSRYYDRTATGRLVGRVTTDVEALQETFSQGVVTILGDLVFLAATVVLLFVLSTELALVTLAVVPVLILVTWSVRGRARAAYRTARSRISRMNAFLHEHLAGMGVVQAFRREDRTQRDFDAIQGELRDAQLSTVRWESTLSTTLDVLESATMALILWYGGGLVLDRPEGVAGGVTIGTLFAFIEYMRRFFQPLSDLSLKYTVLQNALTAAERIFDLLDVDERILEPRAPAAPPPSRGRIEFEDVRFAYEAKAPVFRGLSFRLEPGERVAIVGATGAGKTTVLSLLTRLYDAQGGRVLVDGVDVRDWPLKELRRRIGLVTQDVFLFEGDLLQNLRLGRPDVGEADAIAAAERLHLDRIVRHFPRGWHEPVRERGRNLSAGERQLVAFARVLAAEPEVLLLDEATASIDAQTEGLLQEATRELVQGRSSLIVAHRLSTILDADRILVLHRGELVEEGRHDELMDLRGVYWRLYQLQYSAQEGGAVGGGVASL